MTNACIGCPFRKDSPRGLRREIISPGYFLEALHRHAWPCHRQWNFAGNIYTEAYVDAGKKHPCVGAKEFKAGGNDVVFGSADDFIEFHSTIVKKIS